jgi:hypothetical protein
MACSFHHTGEFIPSASSIKILDRQHAPGFEVFLAEKSERETVACDECRGLGVPLCLEYCTKKDDLKKILGEFSETANQR